MAPLRRLSLSLTKMLFVIWLPLADGLFRAVL
jgi:hypothetical protein